MLLAVSEAVSSLLLFARCLFCQRLECLPSWHRLRLWQRQCTTSPRGRRDLGPHRGWGGVGRGGGWAGGVTRAKSREQDARLPSLLPYSHPLCAISTLSPHTLYQRACAASAEAVATASRPAWACFNASPKAATTAVKGPQPPPAKVGRLSPHIIPIDCLLLCLPIPSIGFVSLDDALHSTSLTLIHTVITFQYQH